MGTKNSSSKNGSKILPCRKALYAISNAAVFTSLISAAITDPNISALPRRANLHWLGQQPYALLPQLVAGWDVCLMPFAINESTEFISPTKTLEYMAAGKPIVSTPIHDVRAMFGELVAIAADAGAFVAGCRDALAESDAERALREERMRVCVGEHSWDAATRKIRDALAAALTSADPVAGDTANAAEGVADNTTTARRVATAG